MTALLLVCLSAVAAEVAPPAQQPYRAVVCLRFSSDPLLTPAFRASVERQVRDQLVNYFGRLAEIQVQSSGHWLVDEFPDRPLDEPELTPQRLVQRGVQGKVFLVAVDFFDGQYRIASRHLDGEMQYVGPVRSRATADRHWVGKAICLAVKDDFLPVATLTPDWATRWVNVEFQGAELDRSLLEDLLGEECILQPFFVLRRRDGSVFFHPVSYTVLRVRAKEAITRAAVISNHEQPWRRTAAVVGFRAIKINTQRGRLRLRVVDAATEEPARQCTVWVNDRGFERLEDRHIVGRPNRDGYLAPAQEYNHLAFVRVLQGNDPPLLIPAPITGPWAEQLVKIRVDPEAALKSDFARSLRFLAQDLQMLDALQSEGVRTCNQLNAEKRYEEAVQAVEQTIAQVRPLIAAAQSSLHEATAQARRVEQSESSTLKRIAQRLSEIENREGELRQMVNSINDQIARRDAQSRANVLIEQAQQAEYEADYDEAIERYKLALAEQPDQPQLRDYLEQLEESWRIKSPGHRRAREFVYQRWSQAEVTEIDALLPEAQTALESLAAAQDRLTMRKLLKANDQHLGALAAVVEQADARGGEADQAERQQYAELIERVAEFNEAVEERIAGKGAEDSPAPDAEGAAPADAPDTQPPPEDAAADAAAEPTGDAGPTAPAPAPRSPSAGTPPPEGGAPPVLALPPDLEEEAPLPEN